MEKHVLILATTHDFLLKFERENVEILQSMGYTVHFAANLREPGYLSDEEAIRERGVVLHHIDIARSPYLVRENQRALRQLLEILRRWDMRALHCHTPVGGLLGRLAGKLSPLHPVVVYTAHGFHFYRGAPLFNRLVYYPVERELARYTDLLLVINQEDEQAARRLPLAPGGKVFRLPGVGLNRQVFSPPDPEERQRIRRRYGVAPGEFLLVSLGELNVNKNHQVVLEALSLLQRRNRLSGVRYVICGEGFARERLQREIQERELPVSLWGFRRDVPQILTCADATVFPSRREGLGMAGLESLAMGVPVLAADNRGTREYMVFGKNGLIYPWNDPAGFARGILLLQGLDPVRRRELSQRCRESVAPFDRTLTRETMRLVHEEMDRKRRERLAQMSGGLRGAGVL